MNRLYYTIDIIVVWLLTTSAIGFTCYWINDIKPITIVCCAIIDAMILGLSIYHTIKVINKI